MADNNLPTEKLSFDEVATIHDSMTKPAEVKKAAGAPSKAPPPSEPKKDTKGAPVMDQSEIDRLLESLGDTDSHKWTPAWATGRSEKPGEHEEGGDLSDQIKEVKEMVAGLETTLATIDDTTANTKAEIESLQKEIEHVSSAHDRIGGLNDKLDTALARMIAMESDFSILRRHFVTLFSLLTTPGALGVALGLDLSKPERKGQPFGADSEAVAAVIAQYAGAVGGSSARPEAPRPATKTGSAVGSGSAGQKSGE